MLINQFVKAYKKYGATYLTKFICSVLLLLVLGFITAYSGKLWFVSLTFSGILFGIFVYNSFFGRKTIVKVLLYVLEYLLLLWFSTFFATDFLSTVYSIILIEFYMNNSTKNNLIFAILSYFSYSASLIISSYIFSGEIAWRAVSAKIVNEFSVFALVFTLVNMLSTIVRKNKEIEKNLHELEKSQAELKKAYEKVEEVTALEERNRIAKQIHDTTGHSITTIIMQTEAAKLKIDERPEEAKKRIIAANLQAVTALEELRKSVRVLSGGNPVFDLKASIEKTINETTDGTGIKIRYKTSDFYISEEKAFFLYSSFKEGLNNGIRHGESTAFFFELKEVDGKIKFLLSDNGVGTDKIEYGFGLKTMKETAEKFGGKTEITSAVGEGFEISIVLPADELIKGENV